MREKRKLTIFREDGPVLALGLIQARRELEQRLTNQRWELERAKTRAMLAQLDSLRERIDLALRRGPGD